jgi:hypothetical protein
VSPSCRVCSVSVFFAFLPLQSDSLRARSIAVGRNIQPPPGFRSIPSLSIIIIIIPCTTSAALATRSPDHHLSHLSHLPHLPHLSASLPVVYISIYILQCTNDPRDRSAIPAPRVVKASSSSDVTYSSRLIRFRIQLTRRCPTSCRRPCLHWQASALVQGTASDSAVIHNFGSALGASLAHAFGARPRRGTETAKIHPLSHNSTHTLTMLRRLIGVLRPLRVNYSRLTTHGCSWGFSYSTNYSRG